MNVALSNSSGQGPQCSALEAQGPGFQGPCWLQWPLSGSKPGWQISALYCNLCLCGDSPTPTVEIKSYFGGYDNSNVGFDALEVNSKN